MAKFSTTPSGYRLLMGPKKVIKIFCYIVTGCHKNSQVRRGSTKNEGSATFCAHRNAIKPRNLKKKHTKRMAIAN